MKAGSIAVLLAALSGFPSTALSQNSPPSETGASYSGEEAAEAGRESEYALAYVMLSPGSFSDESIGAIDSSGVSWLFVAGHHERHLQEITAAVLEESRAVQVIIVPGTGHATRLLDEQPDLAERVAVWLTLRLR